MPEQEDQSWRRRTETWAGLSAALTLAAAIAFAVGALLPGLVCAALAVSLGVVVMLAARLERQHLERRAEMAEAAAASAQALQRRFLSVAGHDLSQPLHAMTLYLSALQKRVEGEEARGILGKADRAAQSLSGMLAAMAEFNRIDAAAASPLIEAVALQDLLERVAANTGIALPEPTALRVRTDSALLEQALTRLAANAAEHGGGGRIALSEDDDEVEIIVADDGPGVAAEDQTRMFEPFVRLGGATQGDGLGLGLAIVRRIVDALGLRLDLKSAPEQGARVSLRAPLA